MHWSSFGKAWSADREFFLVQMEQQEAKARAEAREEAEIREYRRGLEFKVSQMHIRDLLESRHTFGHVHSMNEETAAAKRFPAVIPPGAHM